MEICHANTASLNWIEKTERKRDRERTERRERRREREAATPAQNMCSPGFGCRPRSARRGKRECRTGDVHVLLRHIPSGYRKRESFSFFNIKKIYIKQQGILGYLLSRGCAELQPPGRPKFKY